MTAPASPSAALNAAVAEVEKARRAVDRAQRRLTDGIVAMEQARALAKACERPCLRCGAGPDTECAGEPHRRVSRPPGEDVPSYCPSHDLGVHTHECDRRWREAKGIETAVGAPQLRAGAVARMLTAAGLRQERRGRAGFRAVNPLGDDGVSRDRSVVHVQAPERDLDAVVEALTSEGLRAERRPGLVPIIVVTRNADGVTA